jgi:hypothetical protein
MLYLIIDGIQILFKKFEQANYFILGLKEKGFN